VFRCYNATGERVVGRVRTDTPLAAAERVRADEREPETLELEEGGTVVGFAADPYAIVTLRLTVAPRSARDDSDVVPD
jgi:hypothetical protein